MTTIKNLVGRQPLAVSDYTKNWQDILWCEWRNCNDKEYAGSLFVLVFIEPVDQWLAFALLSGLIGGLGGWLLGMLITGSTAINWMGWVLAGIATGGLGGVLILLAFSQTRFPTWQYWLLGFTHSRLRAGLGRLAVWQNSAYFRFAMVAGSIIGVSITGALFFDQANAQAYFCATVLLVVIVIGIVRHLNYWPGLLIHGSLGILFGLFFGLGFAQLVGVFITPLDLGNSARVVGLAVGASMGLFFGRRAGLWGVIAGLAVYLIIILPVELNLVNVGWLVGLLTGGIAGSLSRIFLPNDRLIYDTAYNYRATFVWWWKRPFAAEVEAALKAMPRKTEQVQAALDQLEQEQQQPGPPERYISGLDNSDWDKRFVARQMMVSLGGEAIADLQSIAGDNLNPLHNQAIWLIQSIGHDTQTRLDQQAPELVCPACITRFGLHTVRVSRRSVDYYGCRTCGQSRTFEHYPQGIVAVLDAKQSEQQAQNGILRVNWLERRELFDFDRVEIMQATDEDVERFAVQVGNDMDQMRKYRYPRLQCDIALNCHLSENSVRVLRHTFGYVQEIGE